MKQKLILLAIALQMFINVPILANDDTYYSDFNYAYKGVFYKVNFTEREAYADGLADSRNLTDVNIQGFTMKGSDIYAIKKIATNVKLEMGGETVDPDKTYTFATTMVWQGFKGSGVTSVQMENSVTTIMADAFMSCTNLKSIQLSSGISEIPQQCFKGCSKLNTITIPANIKTIGYEAFRACSGMSTITLPNGLQTIAEGAFDSCSSLVSIDLPNSVSEVGIGAFIDCKSLESIVISDNLKEIAATTFLGCEKLSSIAFGENSRLETIRQMAFSDCNSLKVFSMPDKLKTLETSNIGASPFGKSAYDYTGAPIERLKISDAISASSLSAMMSEIKGTLTTVTFGKNPTLKNLDILKGCEKLQNVEIPASVTSLSANTFYYAQNLKEINSYIKSPFIITDDVFNSNTYNTATLHVPAGCKDTYKNTTGWKNFKTIQTIGGDQDDTPEPYAALSDDNKTLTFYYDGKKKSRNGMGIGPFTLTIDFDVPIYTVNTEWYDHHEDITIVIFDTSFANYTGLTSTAYWFFECFNLKTIKGWENLNTYNVTDMRWMFYYCRSLENLDLSSINTEKVTRMDHMFYYCSSLKNLNVNLFNTENVTVMWNMFCGCSSLTSLDVTNFNTANVESIDGMFQYCSSLKSLDVSNFNTNNVISMSNMFNHCSSLKVLDVSNFKKSAQTRDGMFESCSSLTTIYCDNAWSSITSKWMFSGCTSLKGAISYDSNKTDVTYANPTTGYFTKKGDKTDDLKDGDTFTAITTEGVEMTFWVINAAEKTCMVGVGMNVWGHPAISTSTKGTVTVPGEANGFKVRGILRNAFCRCNSVTKIDIMSSDYDEYRIDAYAFQDCTSLTDVVFPPNKSVTLGQSAFYDCTSMTSITIPVNMEVNYAALQKMPALKQILVAENHQKYVSVDGVLFSKDLKRLEAYPNAKSSEYIVPMGTEIIWYDAFSYCQDLSKVLLPEGLKTISARAFQSCSKLTDITIPSTVTSFSNIQNAFTGCIGLTAVNSLIQNPLAFTGELFPNTVFENAKLTVPVGTKSIYENTNGWKKFKNIVEIDGGDDDAELKDGDTFTAKTVEGIDMTFKVISATEKTCQVGGTGGLEASIDKEYSGSITIPETINGFRVVTVAFNAFSGSKINSVIIGNNVTYIDQNAFLSCQRLKSVTFPNNNGFRLKYWSFQGCPSLETITLPNNLTSMDGSPFLDCPSLTYIGVEDDNSNYKSIDGVVYSKDSKVIWAYPCGRPSTEYEIIDGTQVIGRAAFMSASKLEEIHIPNSVTRIDDSAFFSCTNLKTLILPPDLTSIPYGLATFSKITEISIPNKVTSIGNNAFHACHSLTSVRVEIEEPLAIDEYTFSNRANATLYVPKGCVEAYSKANYWKDFKEIKEMDGGDADAEFKDGDTFTAKTVEGVEMTFKVISASDKTVQVGTGEKNASAVDKDYEGTVTIPEEINGYKVDEIASRAFSYCNFSEIVLPSGLTYIDTEAFYLCESLKSIRIPSSLQNMSVVAFVSCTSVESIVVEEDNAYFDSREGCNAIIRKDDKALIRGCKNSFIPSGVERINFAAFQHTPLVGSFVIPEGVTYIDQSVFVATTMSSISLPSSLTYIGGFSFQNCDGIENVAIPEHVTYIGDGAFSFCDKLNRVTIPASVTEIGEGAFIRCSQLKTIVSYITEPCAIADNVFMNNDLEDGNNCLINATLYVPYGKKTIYENTNGWKNFKNIVELNATVGDVTGDGEVTKEDITEVETEILEPSEDFDPNKDVNRDGVVNVADIVKSNNIRNSQRQVR